MTWLALQLRHGISGLGAPVRFRRDARSVGTTLRRANMLDSTWLATLGGIEELRAASAGTTRGGRSFNRRH